MMIATGHAATTRANETKLVQLERALAETLADVLRRGFFGSAAVEVTVQDGTIQNIRRRLERFEK